MAGLGHSEEYQAKAEEPDRAIEAALKWFLEERGNCSAEEYRPLTTPEIRSSMGKSGIRRLDPAMHPVRKLLMGDIVPLLQMRD